MVGPLNNTTYKEIGLTEIPNIIFTGGKNLYDLPQYLQYMDCTLIPFLCNTVTKSIYPLKINEYLAAGKSVVATNFSEDINGFNEHIYLADSAEAFIQLIDTAIAPHSKAQIQKRIDKADSNTWTSRVQEFWDLVERYV